MPDGAGNPQHGLSMLAGLALRPWLLHPQDAGARDPSSPLMPTADVSGQRMWERQRDSARAKPSTADRAKTNICRLQQQRNSLILLIANSPGSNACHPAGSKLGGHG